MSKTLALLATVFMLWMIALPGPAAATQNGMTDPGQHEWRVQRRCVRMPPHSYRTYCYYYYPDYRQPNYYGFYWRWY